MALIVAIVGRYRRRARARRGELFRSLFVITPDQRVLDLGSEDGTAFHSLGVEAQVTIADIDAEAVRRGAERYGYEPSVLPESGRLPFSDHQFDVVYCSSVIEHVTGISKEQTFDVRGPEFRIRACETQQAFANEIRRISKRYFVQTPARSFPVESHTWLPFVGWLSHGVQTKIIKGSNRWWVKKTQPDFHLLNSSDMKRLFPDARLYYERSAGMVKSIIAVGPSRLAELHEGDERIGLHGKRSRH